jgi:hypothetical protein
VQSQGIVDPGGHAVGIPRMSEDSGSAAELFCANDYLQRESRAVRLLAATNLGAYATLMERHLDGSAAVAESELVLLIERDLEAVGLTSHSALTLIKSWSKDGWLNRVSDGTGSAAQNVCSLTEDARDALWFIRRLRRADTIATGGSMERISNDLKKVASQLDEDPERVRADIEAQIEALYAQLEELDAGNRPEPNLVNLTDEASSIAQQMEQVINDIVRYGGMQNDITTGLINGVEDSDTEFRERAHRMFSDYKSLYSSRERASYTAFLHTVQNPDKQARLKTDIELISAGLPDLNPSLRQVMRNFFKLVSAQIGEVSRIEQRCAHRINRFFRSGTAEQARGLARQINEAIATGHALLSVSVFDSGTSVAVPMGRSEVSSIGQVTFNIKDPTPPKPAAEAAPPADLSDFGALAAQVDMGALADLINTAVAVGPVTLPELVGMVDTPFLGDVVVLWSMALKQTNNRDKLPTRRVVFHSISGGECAMELPELTFHTPIPDAEHA